MSNTSSARRALALLIPVAVLLAACGDVSDDAADDTVQDAAVVAFTSPEQGTRIAGSVHFEMKAEGFTVEPAGEVREGAGHFHVIADAGCAEPGSVIGKDADHLHFGGGQSEGTIYLGPGEHELCLQPGDGTHVALEPTDTITVTVGVESREEWCAVAAETDELFAAADAGGDDFAARQVQYEGVRRLVAQLTDAEVQIDEAVRADVLGSLAQLSLTAGVYADAVDLQAAQLALAAVGDVAADRADIVDVCVGGG